MKFIYILIALALASLLVFLADLAKKKGVALRVPRRAIALALALVATFRYLLKREAIYYVQGLNMYSPFGENIAQTVLFFKEKNLINDRLKGFMITPWSGMLEINRYAQLDDAYRLVQACKMLEKEI